MGCICNLQVRDDKIPASIAGPVLLVVGVVGLLVDYLGLGAHAAWWYGGAAAAGLAISLYSARSWRRTPTCPPPAEGE